MATTMTIPHGSSLETRPSLLKKLQSDDDPRFIALLQKQGLRK